MNQSKKILDFILKISFIILLFTSIPLFVNYILGQEPSKQLIVHLHVWVGLLFLILAIISMKLQKNK